MGFMVGLPKTFKKHNSIWVIVDRLKKLSHFLPVKKTYMSSQYAAIYIKDIVRVQRLPMSIIFDKGAQFTDPF